MPASKGVADLFSTLMRRVRGSWPRVAAGEPAFAGDLPLVSGSEAADPAARRIPRHLLLQWHITERCNLRCTHCYQGEELSPELDWDGMLGVLAEFDRLLEALGQRAGRRLHAHVTVTGGEPFAHRHVWPLLERLAARRPGLSFAVLTNGTTIREKTAERLRALRPHFIQISIDGAEATHDHIRGPGAYAKAVAGLRHLTRAGIRTMISFTAHRGNYEEFPAVAQLGRSLGVSRVWADRLIPWGFGAQLSNDMLTQDETRRFFALMEQERARHPRHRTEIALHRALQFMVGGGRPYHCTAGDSLITIMPNGDVYPCRRMPRTVGNVTETPLSSIYEQHPLLVRLRDRHQAAAGCEQCFYSESCGGGLRCLSSAIYDDPFRADPGCWRASAPKTAPQRLATPDVTLEALLAPSSAPGPANGPALGLAPGLAKEPACRA